MARYGKEHKQETRERILETAARRFKRDGINASGVAALMADAGLTNGAFYAHFSSKEDLVANVVADQLGKQAQSFRSLPPGRAGLAGLLQQYLSAGHRDNPAGGCPVAALLEELGRCPADARDALTAGLAVILHEIAVRLDPQNPRVRARQGDRALYEHGGIAAALARSDRRAAGERGPRVGTSELARDAALSNGASWRHPQCGSECGEDHVGRLGATTRDRMCVPTTSATIRAGLRWRPAIWQPRLSVGMLLDQAGRNRLQLRNGPPA